MTFRFNNKLSDSANPCDAFLRKATGIVKSVFTPLTNSSNSVIVYITNSFVYVHHGHHECRTGNGNRNRREKQYRYSHDEFLHIDINKSYRSFSEMNVIVDISGDEIQIQEFPKDYIRNTALQAELLAQFMPRCQHKVLRILPGNMASVSKLQFFSLSESFRSLSVVSSLFQSLQNIRTITPVALILEKMCRCLLGNNSGVLLLVPGETQTRYLYFGNYSLLFTRVVENDDSSGNYQSEQVAATINYLEEKYSHTSKDKIKVVIVSNVFPVGAQTTRV